MVLQDENQITLISRQALEITVLRCQSEEGYRKERRKEVNLTDVQVEYAKHLEQQRHNLIQEDLESRKLAQDYEVKTQTNALNWEIESAKIQQQQAELAQKAENDQGRLDLLLQQLSETIRFNDATIFNNEQALILKQQELAELIRSHLANEKQAQNELEAKKQMDEANRLASMIIAAQRNAIEQANAQLKAETDLAIANLKAETDQYIANQRNATELIKAQIDAAEKAKDRQQAKEFKDLDTKQKKLDRALERWKTKADNYTELVKIASDYDIKLKQLAKDYKIAMSKYSIFGSDISGFMLWLNTAGPAWEKKLAELRAGKSASIKAMDQTAGASASNYDPPKPADKSPKSPSTKKPDSKKPATKTPSNKKKPERKRK